MDRSLLFVYLLQYLDLFEHFMRCFLSIFNSLQRPPTCRSFHFRISSHPSLRLLFLLSPLPVKFSLCGSAGLVLEFSPAVWSQTHLSHGNYPMPVAPQLVVELCVHLPLSTLGFYLSGAYAVLLCGIKIPVSSLVRFPVFLENTTSLMLSTTSHSSSLSILSPRRPQSLGVRSLKPLSDR